jgi:hypothetical protein
MNKESVHFRIGKDTGLLIMEIAHEKMFYNLDPKAAIETITESLHGCSIDLAKAIIGGEMVITVDEESQTCNILPVDELKDTTGYEFLIKEFNIPDWYRKKHYEIRDHGIKIHKALDRTKNELVKNIRAFGGVKLTIPHKELFEFISGNDDPLMDYLREQENIKEIFDLIVIVKNYLETTVKLHRVFNVLQDWYSELFEVEANKHLLTEKWMVVDKIQMSFTNFLNQNFDSIIAEVEAENEQLTNYIEANQQIKQTLSKGIEPVNILDNYDAGWLAPDGTYYGLNGEIANMLHNQIADALYKVGIIPNNDENEGNPNNWLCKNGWIRQHNNWILYEGYELGRNIHMTEIQKKKIYEFGALCCKGILKFGILQKTITAARFQMTEPLMIKKLFAF